MTSVGGITSWEAVSGIPITLAKGLVKSASLTLKHRLAITHKGCVRYDFRDWFNCGTGRDFHISIISLRIPRRKRIGNVQSLQHQKLCGTGQVKVCNQ